MLSFVHVSHAFIKSNSMKCMKIPTFSSLQYTRSLSTAKRLFMKVNNEISIPMDKVEFKFARSSGPGGQNVNKLNTKAEVRFHVASADWIPDEVRERLAEYQSAKINNKGELIVVCQEFRTQSKNKDECLSKLKEMIADAYIKPKDRNMWTGIGEKGKENRRKEKKFKSEKKQSRRLGKGGWD